MTYTYNDILCVKDILTGSIRTEDIAGKDGWFTDVSGNLRRAIDEDNLDVLASGTIDHIDNVSARFVTTEGVRWDYFIPKKEPSYEDCQDEWIKANNLKRGDKVRILRKAKAYENGWRNGWVDSMDGTVGKVCYVIADCGCDGIKLGTSQGSWRYPYFILEKVEDKPTYTDDDIISSSNDPRLKTAIGKLVYFHDDRESVLCNANNDVAIGTLTSIDKGYGSSVFFINSVLHWKYIIIKKDQPENKYIPFDLSLDEDKAALRNRWVKSKHTSIESVVTGFTSSNVCLGVSSYTPSTLFRNFTFLDGSVIGKSANKEN